jgi:hypothetical protein
MTTIDTLKSQAKRLRAYLSANKTPFTHSQSLEAVAVMHGHRDWNTAAAALSQMTALQKLEICISPETPLEDLRAAFKNLWRRAPDVIRVQLDAGVTGEQVELARMLASEFEQVGVKVEIGSPA